YMDWRLETPCAAGTNVDCEPVERHVERIAVAGGDAVEFDIEETAWGPVVERLDDGRALALRWVAHLPGSINLGLADLATAANLDEALALADRTAIPTQNLVIGDRDGRIAWRLLGPLPVRAAGCDPRAPAPTAPAPPVSTPPAAATAPGPGVAHAAPAPAVAANDPPTGAEAPPACPPWPAATDISPLAASPAFERIWTANARVASGDELARIGDGGYDLGARARQIRDALHARDRFTEADLLAIQLDDRAVLMGRWWRLLRSLDDEASPALHELAAAAGDWSGRASVDSAGYRIVRA